MFTALEINIGQGGQVGMAWVRTVSLIVFVVRQKFVEREGLEKRCRHAEVYGCARFPVRR